jgi:hypothetical protein
MNKIKLKKKKHLKEGAQLKSWSWNQTSSQAFGFLLFRVVLLVFLSLQLKNGILWDSLASIIM